jgi:hypothetical protein
MNTNDTTVEAKLVSYNCTICKKVHRLSQQSRSYGTSKYDIHYAWREGGPRAEAK